MLHPSASQSGPALGQVIGKPRLPILCQILVTQILIIVTIKCQDFLAWELLMIVLGTAVIQIQDKMGGNHLVRAVVDPGSQLIIVSQRLSQLLNLPVQASNLHVSGIGSESTMAAQGKLVFNLLPHSGVYDSADKPICIEAIILPKITYDMITRVPQTELSKFKNLQLADLTYLSATCVTPKIDL